MEDCSLAQTCDLHFRTLIGTGCNPNVAAVVVIGIEDQWTNIIVEGIAKTGKPVSGLVLKVWAAQHDHARLQGSAGVCALCDGKAARSLQDSELWSSTKCGESDTTSGIASNPTVGNAFDKLYAKGCTLLFGETTEITGENILWQPAAATQRFATSSCSCSTGIMMWSTHTRPRTFRIRSRPRATLRAA